MINAKHILTSFSYETGDALTTLEVTMPRFLVAEFNTHRAFSRNSASSRAIPIVRVIENVVKNPYVPEYFGTYNSGMQPIDYVTDGDPEYLDRVSAWLDSRNAAIESALRMMYPDPNTREYVYALCADVDFDPAHWPTPEVSKELVNRILEPWMMTTVIVSATEWGNFFNLRLDEGAQIDMRLVARAMEQATFRRHTEGVVNYLEVGQWHVPYSGEQPDTIDDLLTSVGKCAKVSYNKQGEPMDLNRVRRLAEAGHWSPFEHVARVSTDEEKSDATYRSNFEGFTQMRHLVQYEGLGFDIKP